MRLAICHLLFSAGCPFCPVLPIRWELRQIKLQRQHFLTRLWVPRCPRQTQPVPPLPFGADSPLKHDEVILRDLPSEGRHDLLAAYPVERSVAKLGRERTPLPQLPAMPVAPKLLARALPGRLSIVV
jgi:hypothetical protein